MKYTYTYVLDTMADWELGYITAELNSGRYFKESLEPVTVKTVGLSKDPIVTMGGMTIVPDVLVEDVAVDTAAVLLLPGAHTWQDAVHAPIIQKAKELLAADVTVAAICGATSALAQAGMLDARPHTSNAPQYLGYVCPDYKGQKFYRPERAVADGNLITASSAGSLLWARYILAKLGVCSDETLEAWCQYYETADPKHFFALLKTLPAERA